MAILEKLSENRNRRGSPKSSKAKLVDEFPIGFQIEGCRRTKINDAYRITFFGMVYNANPVDFTAIMGHTKEEMERGAPFPVGYKTAANEIGRFVETIGANENQKKEIIDIVADERRKGVSFTEIAADFRTLRLGAKKGSVIGLAGAISRAIDEYQRRFPDITGEQIRIAIQSIKVDDE